VVTQKPAGYFHPPERGDGVESEFAFSKLHRTARTHASFVLLRFRPHAQCMLATSHESTSFDYVLNITC